MQRMYYIGLDVHQQMISYCAKDDAGKVFAEGWIPATRFDLDRYSRAPPERIRSTSCLSPETYHGSHGRQIMSHQLAPFTLSLEESLVGELLFEFDDAGAVVDADGAEFAKDVLPQEAVELDADTLGEIPQTHDRHGLGKQKPIRDFQIHAQAQRITHNAGALAGTLDGGRRHAGAHFGADDGVIGAGIEQKRSRAAVHLGINQD